MFERIQAQSTTLFGRRFYSGAQLSGGSGGSVQPRLWMVLAPIVIGSGILWWFRRTDEKEQEKHKGISRRDSNPHDAWRFSSR